MVWTLKQRGRAVRDEHPDARLVRTALHHLRERLHRRLLRALEAALRQEGADDDLQGAPTGQVVVLRRAGSRFTATPALRFRHHVTERGREEKDTSDWRKHHRSMKGTQFLFSLNKLEMSGCHMFSYIWRTRSEGHNISAAPQHFIITLFDTHFFTFIKQMTAPVI